MQGELALVLGGAASGKSDYAESLVKNRNLPMIYIATARAGDAEIKAKVAAHMARRGPGWKTIESPLDPGATLSGLPPGHAVLLDCATMWLSNHMMENGDLDLARAALFDGLARCPSPVVVVSNEVGQGIVPENPLARRFREAQGRLNIALAQRADLVVQVVAGLPNILKGRP